MKILFYNDPSAVFGGTEAYWHDTADNLRSEGMEVLPFSLPIPAHRAFPRFPQQKITNAFCEVIETFKPDIIHLNKNKLFAASITRALKSTHIPVVATVHDYYTIPFATSIRNRLKRWVYPARCCANIHIIPSRAYFDQLKKNNIQGIHHIPHFIDHQAWTYNHRYPADAKRLLYAGRLEKQKGLDVLLNAFRKVLKQDSQLHLTIIGNGSEAGRMKRIIIREGLQSHISVPGEIPRHEMLQHLHRSTLFIMPSRKAEMFGLSGLEAQSSGLPVLASGLAGIREWCHHDETGWLVQPGDAGLLAAGIEYLLRHPDLRERLRHNARQQVVHQFTATTAIDALIALYRSATGATDDQVHRASTPLQKLPVSDTFEPDIASL